MVRLIIPTEKFFANTGPKGVIADAQAFEDAKLSVQSTRYLHISGEKVLSEELAVVDSAGSPSTNTTRFDGPLSDEDSEEDAFLATWRHNRFLEEGSEEERRPSSQRRRLNKPAGLLKYVNSAGFLTEVEKPGMVVVLIDDDRSKLSILLKGFINDVAEKHRAVTFISIRGADACIDAVGLPGIVAYRGGEQIACLVPLVDYLPDTGEFCEEMVEAMLKENSLLSV